MESKDLIYGLVILAVLYWYFNIRGLKKCITLNPKCDGVKCVRQKIE